MQMKMKSFKIWTLCCILVLAAIKNSTGEDAVSIWLNGPAEIINCDIEQSYREKSKKIPGERSSITTLPPVVECQKPFRNYNGKCLFISDPEVQRLDWNGEDTWIEARENCWEIHGDLAQTEDVDELINFVKSEGLEFKSYWIGASDHGYPCNFHWLSGNPLTSGWRTDQVEPDNDHSGFDCVYIRDKGLGDQICSHTFPFICASKETLAEIEYKAQIAEEEEFCNEPVVSCQEPFRLYSGKCLFISKDVEPWSEARKKCQNINGDLAEIEDVDALINFVKMEEHDSTMYWIGASDRGSPHSFHWLSGNPVTSPWRTYQLQVEPNYEHPGQDCVYIWVKGIGDLTCEHALGYVCASN